MTSAERRNGTTVELAYGRGALPLTLPPGAKPTVIRKAVLPKLADGRAAVNAAFANPVASRGKNNCCRQYQHQHDC